MDRAVAIIIRRGNKILLGKRTKRYGYGQYQLPGGSIDRVKHLKFFTRDENDEVAAARELFEETGLKAEKLRYFSNCYGNDHETGNQWLTSIYEAFVPEGEPINKEPDKCAGWEWFDLNDLPSPLFEAGGVLKDYVEQLS